MKKQEPKNIFTKVRKIFSPIKKDKDLREPLNPPKKSSVSPSFLNSLLTGASSSPQKDWVNTLDTDCLSVNREEAYYLTNNAYLESAFLRLMIDRPTDWVIGQGLTIEPNPVWNLIPFSEDSDEKKKWVSNVTEQIDLYMSSKKCDRSGKNTGYELQRFYYLSFLRENDVFIRMYYDEEIPQLEFIPPSSIDGVGNDPYIKEGEYWNEGIKKDDKGREISFSIVDGNDFLSGKDGFHSTNFGRKNNNETINAYSSSGKVLMFHCFLPEFIQQNRGITRFVSCIKELGLTVDYVRSVVNKAIAMAAFTGFVERKEQSDGTDIFADNDSGSTDFWQNGNVGLTDTGEEFRVQRTEFTEAMSRGTDFIGNLSPNETIKFLEDKSPGPMFDKFLSAMFGYMCASTRWSSEVILQQFNSNYTAARGALLECYRTAKIEQSFVKSDFISIWYEAIFEYLILTGKIKCPGWQDKEIKQAYLAFNIQGAPLPSISPKDDAAHWRTSTELGISNLSKITREANGSSNENNIAINNQIFDNLKKPPWFDW